MNRTNRSNTSTTPPPTKDRVRTAWVARCAVLVTLWFTAVVSAQLPAPTGTTESTPWLGQEQRIEEHLKNAGIASIKDIGTGVTRPRRAYLTPSEPVESVAWKVLPPGRRGGFWESYKSEIAAYELDRLLNMHMVPPTVERRIADETGAAVMWVKGVKSVKELGGKVPSGPEVGKAAPANDDVRQLRSGTSTATRGTS